MRGTLTLKAKVPAKPEAPLRTPAVKPPRDYPRRPEIALAEGPHWIVSRLPPTVKPGTSAFRHPTRESAEAEAARLSRLVPGVSFVVYASGAVFCEPLGSA